MRKAIFVAVLIFLGGTAGASNNLNISTLGKNLPIPGAFLSSSETEALQWGCPVADLIKADNTQDAMAKIGQACMDDVRKAATEKPGVFDVIRVSVVWPDVQVSSTRDGYKMEGTIFLETLVMKGQETH